MKLGWSVAEDINGETALPSPSECAHWAETALRMAGRETRDWELALRIVDRTEMADLNQRFRGKSGPTNVLSFPYESVPGVDLPILGDLAICAPVVAAEAQEQGKAVSAHWAHLVVHGVLHLCGHDHIEASDALLMEALERDILASLAFPDPYDSGSYSEQGPTPTA